MDDSMIGAPSALNLIVPNAGAGETVDLHRVGVSPLPQWLQHEEPATLKFEGG